MDASHTRHIECYPYSCIVSNSHKYIDKSIVLRFDSMCAPVISDHPIHQSDIISDQTAGKKKRKRRDLGEDVKATSLVGSVLQATSSSVEKCAMNSDRIKTKELIESCQRQLCNLKELLNAMKSFSSDSDASDEAFVTTEDLNYDPSASLSHVIFNGKETVWTAPYCSFVLPEDSSFIWADIRDGLNLLCGKKYKVGYY